ncbi:winged helix-turn-helix domain-containing protein [Halarcobacter sp.]|uniref:response regulator transcription factor n=1 Tax=Halarcobacter sp. TaxID=2321133 RepID=UPI0029F5C0C4|nr:winged helix-turn-helix domain-containing protein [Halarcobacter sp.]
MRALRVLVLKDYGTSIIRIINILEKNSFDLNICETTNEFLEYTYYNHYDLYIIDIDDKNISRFKFIKLLNEYKDKTMKLVIAKRPNIMKASFLYGCDECIVKSIDESELLLRIKALIRREYKVHSDLINISNNIVYDIFRKKILKNKSEIFIGQKSLQIIAYLLKYRGFFVSSKNLENGVYPANSNNKNGSIRFHIHKIRQIIGEDIIISNRTSGYKINIQ